MRLVHFVLLLIAFVCFSCERDDEAIAGSVGDQNFEPGVVITLDDDYIDHWADAHSILQEYQWKATFFITKCNQLSNDEISSLLRFKQYRHEIGGHGLNHVNAPQVVALAGSTEYLNDEIYPMMQFMDVAGLHTTSFAYPFGARNETTDALLLNKFDMLRGATYGQAYPMYQNCYYTGRKVVYALGIDKSYPHFNLPNFISLLQYAKNNNKIVVFYAHRTVAVAKKRLRN